MLTTEQNICDGSTITVIVQGLVIFCHLPGMAPFTEARRLHVSIYL